MKRKLKSMALVLLAVLLLLAGTSALRAQGTDSGADGLLTAINALRSEAGLARLEPDARLACAARRHAADNARRGGLDHIGADGADLTTRLARVGYPYRMAAENLVRAGADATEILALWRASPGHRRNLLQPRAHAAGIGRIQAGGRWVWIVVIASENGQSRGKQGISTQSPCVSG